MSQMSQAGGAPPGPVRRTPPSAPPRRSTPASTPGSSATPFARCSPLVAAAHQPKPSFARCCNRTSARESDARGFPFPRQNNAVYPPSTRVSALCHAERRTVIPSWTSVAFLRIPALSHGPHLADRVRGCADRKAVRLRRRYCRHAEAAQPSPYPGATCCCPGFISRWILRGSGLCAAPQPVPCPLECADGWLTTALHLCGGQKPKRSRDPRRATVASRPQRGWSPLVLCGALAAGVMLVDGFATRSRP